MGGYAILGLAVGQFCPMLLRSSLLAGVVSIPLTAALAAWCWLMAYLEVNLALGRRSRSQSALLLATRLRTAGWLVERNDFRAWLRPLLALIVPAVALLTAVPLYRRLRVPARRSGLFG